MYFMLMARGSLKGRGQSDVDASGRGVKNLIFLRTS